MQHSICTLFAWILLSMTTTTAQVVISEILDASDNFNNRFVEITNIDQNSIDISLYRLERYANGNTNAAWIQVPDGTILAPGETFVFAHSSSNLTLAQCNASVLSNLVSGNGDDVYAIHDGYTIVDVYGVIGTDGTGTAWEYTDSRVIRNIGVTGPNATFNLSEWTINNNSNTASANPCISQFTFGCLIYDEAAVITCLGASLEFTITWSQINGSQNFEVSLDGGSFVPLASGGTLAVNAPVTYEPNYTIEIRDVSDPQCNLILTENVAACPGTGLSNLDTVKVMTYNVLRFPDAALNGVPNVNDSDRTNHFLAIIAEAKPDVILLQELTSGNGDDQLVNALNANTILNTTWSSAPYSSTEPLKSGCIYNDDKFDFVTAFDIPQTNTYNGEVAVRPNTVFELVAQSASCTSETISCQYISVHTKAGTIATDVNQRTAQLLDLSDYLNSQAVNANIVCGGDFNVYADDDDGSGYDEPGYVALTAASNSNPAIDILGGWERNTASEAWKYTQSTMSTTTHGHTHAAMGGLDDRFDLLFVTDAIANGTNEMEYISGTYATFGNVGVTHNQNASSGNSPVGTELEYMSDHYPVIMDIRLTYTNCVTCPTSSVETVDYLNEAKLIEVEQGIQATNSISGSSAIFYSGGTEICLDPGFEVQAGAVFQAYIQGCNQ